MNAVEEEYAAKSAQRAAQLEKAGFWRGIQQDLLSAQFLGGPSIARRQGVATQLQKLGFEAELTAPGFMGLDERIKEMGDPATWKKNYLARARAAGQNLTPYDADTAFNRQFGNVQELQQRRAAIIARQGAQGAGLAEQQGYERMQWTTGIGLRTFMAQYGGITQAESRAREIEQMRVRHELEMGGPEGSPTRLKKGTDEYNRLAATQAAERIALEKKFYREDEDRDRQHWVVMKDAMAGATLDREAMRKREMERIREAYAEDIRKFGETEEIKNEIAAREGTLRVQQAEERRSERAGIIGSALTAAGGGYADQARRLELEEMQRRRRMAHPEMAALFDRTEAAERAELEAQLNWKPGETGSRQMLHGAGRPGGYDAFLPGLTPEMRVLQGFLDKNLNTLEKIAGMIAAIGGNLGVAPSPPGG